MEEEEKEEFGRVARRRVWRSPEERVECTPRKSLAYAYFEHKSLRVLALRH